MLGLMNYVRLAVFDTCRLLMLAYLLALINAFPAIAAVSEETTGSDDDQGFVKESDRIVAQWNRFAERLDAVHRFRLSKHPTTTRMRIGGFHGLPKYYREIEFRSVKTNLLLSRIQKKLAPPNEVISMEVFFYDKRGRLSADYLVNYLLDHRNAPIQALVNIYEYDNDLSAFRQFDASGNRTFERCWGSQLSTQVDLWLDESIIPPSPNLVHPEIYASCFSFLPEHGGRYLNPTSMVEELKSTDAQDRIEQSDSSFWAERLAAIENSLATSPQDLQLLQEKGDTLFALNRMQDAATTYETIINLNDDQDEAYFGRGMAMGRMGLISEGIADLTTYLERNPNSSIGYTKRGVRHIWNRNFAAAEVDLIRAIELDSRNAEAHDDLGAVLAQTSRVDQAIEHFRRAVELDSSYLKAHHNLALALYLVGDLDSALSSVDNAIRLDSQVKNTLKLKSVILKSLGRADEAAAIESQAEFLPDGHWTEQSPLQ